MSYELAPIQLPTLETCKRLQELGVLPPKDETIWAVNPNCEIDWDGTKETIYFTGRFEKQKDGSAYFDYYECYMIKKIPNTFFFAPTLDQIRGFIANSMGTKQIILDFLSNRKGGLYSFAVIYSKNGHCPLSPTFSHQNEAEAAAQLLIHLIENQLL